MGTGDRGRDGTGMGTGDGGQGTEDRRQRTEDTDGTEDRGQGTEEGLPRGQCAQVLEMSGSQASSSHGRRVRPSIHPEQWPWAESGRPRWSPEP